HPPAAPRSGRWHARCGKERRGSNHEGDVAMKTVQRAKIKLRFAPDASGFLTVVEAEATGLVVTAPDPGKPGDPPGKPSSGMATATVVLPDALKLQIGRLVEEALKASGG